MPDSPQRLEVNIGDLDLLDFALRGAVIVGDFKAVDECIRQGANVDARDRNGQTPLHLASKYAEASVVSRLIERRADVNAVDCELRTALHCAVESMNSEVYGCLIRAGVNLAARDARGQSAADTAKEMQLHHSANLLQVLAAEQARRR